MSDKKISQLTAATTPLAGTETLPIVQGGNTVKATSQAVANLAPVPSAAKITALTGATTPLSGTEEVILTQGGSTKKTTAQAIANLAGGVPNFNLFQLYESGVIWSFNSSLQILSSSNVVINFLGLGMPSLYEQINLIFANAIQVKNASTLTALKDGSNIALDLRFNSLSATEINSLFTQLPATTNTATVDVSNNPGAATCNQSIATGKGYTVIVA